MLIKIKNKGRELNIKHMVCSVVCIYGEIAEFKVTHNKEIKETNERTEKIKMEETKHWSRTIY